MIKATIIKTTIEIQFECPHCLQNNFAFVEVKGTEATPDYAICQFCEWEHTLSPSGGVEIEIAEQEE